MSHEDYLDFDVEIGLGQGREYPVNVIHSPAGEARSTLRFPYDELALESRLKDLEIALLRSGGRRRQALSREEQAVQDFGRDLFDALFTGEVRSRYDVSLERARRMDQGIRLKLRIQPAELAVMPWEFLYDPRQAEYVCLSRSTPVVRYLEPPQPIQPLGLTPPLRILGMVASPGDLPSLDVASEKQRVERAVAGLQAQGLVELRWLAGQTWRDLQRAMRGGPWHVFHFIGHGGFDQAADEGFIALADEVGEFYRLSATQLGRLLADQRSLRLALLNACEGARGGGRDIFSSTASILVRRGIPAVLAMQYEITDRAAIEFARAFYEALADGMPVDEATVEARKAVSLAVANSMEWGALVLTMRTPDGRLFSLAERPTGPPPSPPEPEPAVRPSRPGQFGLTSPIRLELVRVPAGEFLMGSDPAKDEDARADEQPQHRVYVSEFYIGKYPVTNTQYAAFVQATKQRAPFHWKGGKIPRGIEDHPVVNVSWRDAVTFCNWLSDETGQAFRLPTEAEWEKAARGTDGRRYPWGNQPPDDRRLNFNMKVGDTTPVGRYSPQGDSPYGAADMSGNAWEWCADRYDENEYQRRAKSVARDPQGTEQGLARVLRGGSFDLEAPLVRCAVRNWPYPDYRSWCVGFRVGVGGPFPSGL